MAAGYDLRDLIPEPGLYLFQACLAARIFGGVVQEGGDHLVLRSAVLADDGRDGQQVGDVGDIGALAGLLPVQTRGVDQRVFKLLSVRQGFLQVL